jgi:hypothetical protein
MTPAKKLNRWSAIDLRGDNFNEIPYTPEFAVFFDRLIEGIVNLSYLAIGASESPESIRKALLGTDAMAGLLGFLPGQGSDALP